MQKKTHPPSTSLKTSPIHFPPAWSWFMDDFMPQWVKNQYSPYENWKNKPFSNKDAQFFLKGIEDLSTLFTEERHHSLFTYFQHAKYRSSYLLYFLPLQAAKFLTLFQLHPKAFQAMMDHGQKNGILRIADLGAGPGTASISLLLHLLSESTGKKDTLPPIEFHWFDLQTSILTDGKALVEALAQSFPKLRDKVTIHLHPHPWWKATPPIIPATPDFSFSLVFIGHVLNESPTFHWKNNLFWKKLLQKTAGGGILLLEPATRKSSQILCALRNQLFENSLLEQTARHIWGPCLHAGECPLAVGRDWCHFSIPLTIPGQWFKIFSEALSTERHWIKFAYLWLTPTALAPQPPLQCRRVVSDPLRATPHPTQVLLCEPERTLRWNVPLQQPTKRGDIIHLKDR